MAKTYNVQGDYRQLEFSIELAFVGHSASLSALNFDTFLNNHRLGRGQQQQAGVEFNSTSLLDASSRRRTLLERRLIRWQEAIPRPTILLEAENGATKARRMGAEMEEEDEGRRRVEETDEEEEEDNDEVPEDPAQDFAGRRAAIRGGSGRGGGPKKILSHRLFTRLEVPSAFPAAADAPEAMGLQPQQMPRKKRIAPLEQSALKEPIRWNFPAEQKRRARTVAMSEQSMSVMAYLGDPSLPYDTAEEFLLWELTLINGRLLRVHPDFGQRLIHSSRSGTFEALIASNEQIHFDTLDGRGKGWDWEAAEEDEAEEKEEADEEDGEQQHIAAGFEMAERGGIDEYWLHFMLEIASASDFPSGGSLCVHWLLDLPANVVLMQPQMASGRTQLCDRAAAAAAGTAHFGHLLQFKLRYDSTKCSRGSRLLWPRILFQVVAQDGWGRFHVDGYASLPLPPNPGSVAISVECWRPAEELTSKLAALRNAHLGQPVGKLADFGPLLGQVGDGTLPSADGLQTVATGRLGLQLRCVHQCKQFIARDLLPSLRYGRYAQQRRAGLDGGLHWRIAKVLEEFERARQQLLALRSRRRTRGAILRL